MKRKMIFFIYTILLWIGVFFLLALETKVWEGYGQTHCVLDCLLAAESPWIFGLFYLTLSVMLMKGQKIQAAFILAYKNRSNIWRKEIKSALRGSIINGTLFSIGALLSACLLSELITNWGMENSRYFIKTDKVYTGSWIWIYLSFCIWTIWKSFCFTLFMVVLEYKYGVASIGWILTGICICLEWGFQPITLYFKRFNTDYLKIANPKQMFMTIILAILLTGVLYMWGRNVIKDKEFYE